MKVLSLFDGISCGRIALDRAGIPVERYDTFEIDKYAIEISQKNYPDIVHHGDVFDGDFTQFKGYDLLIGGSPCTYWSIAKKGRETTADGVGFKLFMEYVRALRESECRYFLYENNYSIHKDIKAEISKHLGVEPIMINSALVSAQSRKRCYWTNIPDITQPENKGILINDIVESGMSINTYDDKARTIKAQYYRNSIANAIRQDGFGATMVVEPVISQRGHGYNKGGIKEKKVPTLTAQGKFEYNNFVIEPIRVGGFGSYRQAERIYSPNGKSVALKAEAGGYGAKTGLYAFPATYAEESKRIEGVHLVKDEKVTLKGKEYPIKLQDGYYTFRKLTTVEAERLQTLPDNYTEGISSTQRYKCIGNGWTVDVIAHILKGLKT